MRLGIVNKVVDRISNHLLFNFRVGSKNDLIIICLIDALPLLSTPMLKLN